MSHLVAGKFSPAVSSRPFVAARCIRAVSQCIEHIIHMRQRSVAVSSSENAETAVTGRRHRLTALRAAGHTAEYNNAFDVDRLADL